LVKDKINIRLGNKMIIPYIFCVCINKDNKITIVIQRKKGSRTPYITKNLFKWSRGFVTRRS
jgi:hypothetical protein